MKPLIKYIWMNNNQQENTSLVSLEKWLNSGVHQHVVSFLFFPFALNYCKEQNVYVCLQRRMCVSGIMTWNIVNNSLFYEMLIEHQVGLEEHATPKTTCSTDDCGNIQKVACFQVRSSPFLSSPTRVHLSKMSVSLYIYIHHPILFFSGSLF